MCIIQRLHGVNPLLSVDDITSQEQQLYRHMNSFINVLCIGTQLDSAVQGESMYSTSLSFLFARPYRTGGYHTPQFGASSGGARQ